MSTERRNTQNEEAEDALGVLDSTGAIGTADIGLLGESTAQVPVALPVPDDDDLVDDDVTDGEAFADLVLDADPADLVRGDDGIGRIHQGAGISDIVIEIPAVAAEEVVVAELVEDATARDHDVAGGVEGDASGAANPSPQAAASDEPAVQEDAPAEEAAVEDVAAEETVVDPIDDQVDAPDFDTAFDGTAFDEIAEDVNAGEVEFPVDDDAEAVEVGEHAEPVADVEAEEDTGAVAEDGIDDVAEDDAHAVADHESSVEPVVASVVPAELVLHAVDGTSPAPVRALDVNTAPTVAAAATEEEIMTDDHARASEPDLTSRRLDQLGDRERESADLLTADRLLDASRLAGPEPEGLWSHLLYTVSGRRINLGDGKRAQQRKALSARIASPLSGTARFVPVLSRKGGVGKTTVTALLGMALADAREDRVIAVDANPDRGTLADRIARTNSKTVRDLVRIHDQVTGYHDISAVVSRDATRLDVLASDADPRVSEAFNDEDYDQVASVAAHYYSLVLTDTGTGIVHSVMGAILDRADTLVIVAGLSVDEARLASETLTWLEANGYAAKVREAVVVLNQSTPGTPMVRLGELEAHFRTRVAHVLRLPYDARIAAGSAITFAALQPETRQAARELAAIVVEGLRAQAA
ncbi:nucleotide-binding protein [Microbacterium sp. 22303]|uniref:MinD/ParA family ATP-binding protein n=1 Tax=Microbacterium sp. 22303 TaxID=3453905 RepID=UPI003F82A8A1